MYLELFRVFLAFVWLNFSVLGGVLESILKMNIGTVVKLSLVDFLGDLKGHFSNKRRIF